MAPQNKYEGFDSARVTKKGEYFAHGEHHYVVEVENISMVSSQNSGDLYTVEMKVLESDCPSARPGSTRTYQVKMSNKNTAFPNIKGFLAAVFGLEADDPKVQTEITTPVFLASFDETLNKDYLGGKLNVHTRPVSTDADKTIDKAKGNPPGTTRSFTAVNFKPFTA